MITTHTAQHKFKIHIQFESVLTSIYLLNFFIFYPSLSLYLVIWWRLQQNRAVVATIWFGYVKTETIFLICGITGFIGAFLAFMFTADMTCVSSAEHCAQLELYLEGRIEEYKGQLNEPKHLSFFERLTGRHGEYDPTWAKDFVQREESKGDVGLIKEEELSLIIEDEAEA